MTCWKILRDKPDGLHALFHGINGSRKLPRRTWLTAERKLVREAAGRRYWSGFHVLPSRDLAHHYLRKFRAQPGRRLVVVPVEVRHARRKGPRTPVLLVRKLMIP